MLSIQRQSGAVLLVGLVLILILSVLVISASRTTVLQQKMTSNLRDKELSFQSAETALKTGEHYLLSASPKDLVGVFDGIDGLYTFDKARQLDQESDWEALDDEESHSLFQVKGRPVYIIEELPDIRTSGDSLAMPKPIEGVYYRVTSKSKGGTDASLSILQSMYKK